MKIERGEVEDMLSACERDRIGPHPGNETLAELCRTWLAVQDAPVVQIGGADGLSAFLACPGKVSLPSMQGQRVRLVRDGGE